VFRINTEDYKTYIKRAPRNYSIILMLTALNRNRECQFCQCFSNFLQQCYLIILLLFRKAYEEYEIVAQSYRFYNMHSKQLYFALVDYDEGSDVFNMVKW